MNSTEIEAQNVTLDNDVANVAARPVTYICSHCDAVIAEPRPAAKKKKTFVCERGHEVSEVGSFGMTLVGGLGAGIVLFLIFFLLPFGVLYAIPWKLIQTAFCLIALMGVGGIYYGPYLVLKGFYYALRSATSRRLAGGTIGMGVGLFLSSAGAYGMFLYIYGLVAFARVIGIRVPAGLQ